MYGDRKTQRQRQRTSPEQHYRELPSSFSPHMCGQTQHRKQGHDKCVVGPVPLQPHGIGVCFGGRELRTSSDGAGEHGRGHTVHAHGGEAKGRADHEGAEGGEHREVRRRSVCFRVGGWSEKRPRRSVGTTDKRAHQERQKDHQKCQHDTKDKHTRQRPCMTRRAGRAGH